MKAVQVKAGEVLFVIRLRGEAEVVTMKTLNEEKDILMPMDKPAELVIEAFKARYPYFHVVVQDRTVQ